MSHPAQHHLSYAEYLALELTTETRHEYLDGEAWAMAGGSPRHSKIKTNLAVELGNALGDGPCQPYDSDLRIRTMETGLATYADLTIVCGPLERHPEDPHAVTNPAVVIEVLSPSTEGWDRGGKFRHLGRCPSLQVYVLVSQDEPLFEVYTRGSGSDSWELRRYRGGQCVTLDTIGVEIEVERVYRNLPAEAEESS